MAIKSVKFLISVLLGLFQRLVPSELETATENCEVASFSLMRSKVEEPSDCFLMLRRCVVIFPKIHSKIFNIENSLTAQ